eukprot:2252571-Alexandrium_andersonii.AAC.1
MTTTTTPTSAMGDNDSNNNHSATNTTNTSANKLQLTVRAIAAGRLGEGRPDRPLAEGGEGTDHEAQAVAHGVRNR